ncbi:MAG: hypothetical protein IPL12_20570 [Bacteroidetes bacterium]|nr:hypothetical protein [Bacteroidota bacterium]
MKVRKHEINLPHGTQRGKRKFIQSWGSLGSQWGINRTMAQIHALLLIAPEALSTRRNYGPTAGESRQREHEPARELMNWQLVRKEVKTANVWNFCG